MTEVLTMSCDDCTAPAERCDGCALGVFFPVITPRTRGFNLRNGEVCNDSVLDADEERIRFAIGALSKVGLLGDLSRNVDPAIETAGETVEAVHLRAV